MDTIPSFATSYFHFPISTYFLQMGCWLEKGPAIFPNQMCAVAVSIQYPRTPLGRYGKVQEGKWWSQRFPPPFLVINHAWQHRISYFYRHRYWHYTHCHSSPPRNYKKLGGKKFTTSYPCNLWTNTTNISKSAFLSWRQGNVCHLYNDSILLPLWPFGEFNRTNWSSFTRRDNEAFKREKITFSHEKIFQKVNLFKYWVQSWDLSLHLC